MVTKDCSLSLMNSRKDNEVQRAGENGSSGGERERREQNLGIYGVSHFKGTVSELLVRDGFCQRKALSTGSGMERRQSHRDV